MSQRIGETIDEARTRINAERRARYATSPDVRRKVRDDQRRRRATPEGMAKERARRRRLEADPEWRRVDRLKRRARQHHLTVPELEAMLAKGCGICGAATMKNGNSLHVDHDHACCPGERSCGACIRGVLCYVDNVHFERFLDSPRVVAYLERTEAGRSTLARELAELPE